MATPLLRARPSAGLGALFVGLGLARFGLTPLVPLLVAGGWVSSNAAGSVVAANLGGYIVGAGKERRLPDVSQRWPAVDPGACAAASRRGRLTAWEAQSTSASRRREPAIWEGRISYLT